MLRNLEKDERMAYIRVFNVLIRCDGSIFTDTEYWTSYQKQFLIAHLKYFLNIIHLKTNHHNIRRKVNFRLMLWWFIRSSFRIELSIK